MYKFLEFQFKCWSSFQAPLRATRICIIQTLEGRVFTLDRCDCCHTCQVLKNKNRRSDPLYPTLVQLRSLQQRNRDQSVCICHGASDTSEPKVCSSSANFLILFISLPLNYHPGTAGNFNCCMGFLMFSHLNGIRATHGLGYVDRLVLFPPTYGDLQMGPFSNSWRSCCSNS